MIDAVHKPILPCATIMRRLPAAAFPRYEGRADGCSAGRQAAFLAHLADHGIVEDAARTVGMSLGGGYALRRQARGYAFNLGWEAALIIARRVVSGQLMTEAIKGEQSRWVREDGVTTYTRQNSKLSMALLDRVNPATSLEEVLAVATRFDWFLQLIDEGADAQCLWDDFFDDALPHSEARRGQGYALRFYLLRILRISSNGTTMKVRGVTAMAITRRQSNISR